jgi:uncharacterized protein (DUF736 family)
MGTIGTLNPTRNGGWIGLIFILAHRVRITLAPNDNRANGNAPQFRIFYGNAELGALWRRRTKEAVPRDYLSGEIDFAGAPEPIPVTVFFSDDGQSARMKWARRREGDAKDQSPEGSRGNTICADTRQLGERG